MDEINVFQATLLYRVRIPEIVYSISQGLFIQNQDADHVAKHNMVLLKYGYRKNEYYDKKPEIVACFPNVDRFGNKYIIRSTDYGFEIYEKEVDYD